MPREDAITVQGAIVEVLKETVFRVELANRHRLLAHVSNRARSKVAGLSPGDKVTVEISPYDLSKGRIKLDQTFEA